LAQGRPRARGGLVRWWHSSDIEIGGDPADERVSIGARGLTGDDYHGHVFWDTEIYLLPFYIFTWPEAARALLMYRFRTIDGARHNWTVQMSEIPSMVVSKTSLPTTPKVTVLPGR
jgi:hypothetical protein